MTDAPNAAPQGDRALNVVEIGGERVTVERVSARKASSAFSILRGLGDAIPQIVKARAKFVREYEADNVVELDRVQARLRFPRRPLLDENSAPLYEADTLPDGSPNPNAGELVLAPSPLDAMSEEDWERAGNVMRLPKSPDLYEELAAVFPVALDEAEEQVYSLLALFTMTNAEVKRARREGGLKPVLEARVEELLDDAGADELLELAVVVIEVINAQFRSKLDALGDRAGNALAALGLGNRGQAPQTTPQPPQTTESNGPETSSSTVSNSTPTSSTDTAAPTDGDPTTPSTPPTTSSSRSDDASSAMLVG